MSETQLMEKYDKWLQEDGPAAVVMRQWLVPVEGKDAVIFPPTYPIAVEGNGTGYNIDNLEEGLSVCQIDSVGSQANRMEPIFKRAPYDSLVPQVIIKAGDKKVNLLDAGHRAADAIVRFSDDLADKLEAAFRAVQDEGNAEPLAKIAPTSIVFGSWDSRGTGVKLPRVVRSVIRGFNVRELHRSAQYIPPIDYVAEELLERPEGEKQQKAMSELGLSHAPATWKHGGVLVRGGIRREAVLSLPPIRILGAKEEARALMLRRYVLGLALVAFTAPSETLLRQGCELVPDPDQPAEWELVHHDGKRETVSVSATEALEYAQAVAGAFKVEPSREATFRPASAKEALGLTKQERKAGRRSGRTSSGEGGQG